MTLRDKVVVVTGASGGAGRATVGILGGRGARVALIARGEAGLAQAALDVGVEGGTGVVYPADVAVYDEVRTAAERIEHDLGPIDVWMNVAFTTEFAPFQEITPEEYARITS